VLAGGRARRFGGRDKASLVVEGRRIIERQLDAFLAVTPHVLIVVNDASRYGEFGVRVVADAVPDAGPLAGLYTALVTAPTPQIVAVACDMPYVETGFLAHLARAGRDVEAAVPRRGSRWHPLCASYSRACAERFRLRLATGRLAVVEALSDLQVREIADDELARHDPQGRLFTNVNTETDYRRLTT
jgi:molybdopterin-guanine dinucleotide biosynthesis protein A